MEKILRTLDYTVTRNLYQYRLEAVAVMDRVNKDGGNLERVYDDAKSRCEDNRHELARRELSKEQNKTQEKSRDFERER
jgi:hypothetical protein